MYTCLVMSNGVKDSLKGTVRAFIASLCIGVIAFLWYGSLRHSLYKEIPYPPLSYKSVIYLVLAIGLISSGLAVQNKNLKIEKKVFGSTKESLTYSFLVGIVSFGTVGLVYASLYPLSFLPLLSHTLFGGFVCVIAAILMNKIFPF